jgi:hypothetical protein
MSKKTALELNQELAHELTGERGHTIKSIFLIAEIERDEIFVELGYGSMWDFLRRVHKQSDTMIHYRLRCARAVMRFPQVIEPLRDGSLCITTLAELMKIMNESNCDELLAEALGKSVRHARRMVAKKKPKHVPKDVATSLVSIQVGAQETHTTAAEQPVQTEILTESLARKHMTIDREYEDLLKQARAALSHKMPGAAELDILKEGLRQIVKQDAKRKGIVDRPRAERVAKNGKISQSVKRIVRKRDQDRCQWPSEDGEICGSTYRVQFHHKQDRGKGGEGTPDNVIQLCQRHNLLAAEISWGAERIAEFRKQPSATEDLQSQLEFK